jgi:predicted Zn-dependent protease
MQANLGVRIRVSFLVVAVGLGCSIVAAWTSEGAGQAVKENVKAPAAAEDDMDVIRAAASAKIREGRLDDALTLIKEKAAKHPEWPPAHFILAQFLFEANQIAQGRLALEQSAALDPDRPDAYILFGRLAHSEGRLSDARLNFDNVLLLAGSGRWDAQRTRYFRTEGLKGLSDVCISRQDWKGANTHLSAWLELEPKNGQTRYRYAQVQFRLGKAKEAFESLKQATNDAPGLDPAGVSMAFLYGSAGDFKKAEDWFDYARKLEPENSRIPLAHAGWLLNRGETASARKEIDEALKLDPTSKDSQRVSAMIAWYQRDFAGAEKILDPIQRKDPADWFTANLLALTLIEQEDKAKRSRGLQIAEGNANQFPQAQEAATTLGWALYRAGRVDEAQEKLSAGVAAGGMTPDVAYFLARVLVDKGKIEDARRLLQTATAQPGAFGHRDDATALLKTLAK